MGATVVTQDGTGRALADIRGERCRQMHVEGWTTEHDDGHTQGQMAMAAASYAIGKTHAMGTTHEEAVVRIWPWATSWWKPSDQRRNLVKAGALIVAEIERLDRIAKSEK